MVLFGHSRHGRGGSFWRLPLWKNMAERMISVKSGRKSGKKATGFGSSKAETRLRELQGKKKFQQAFVAKRGGDFGLAVKLCREAVALGFRSAGMWLNEYELLQGEEKFRQALAAEKDGDFELAVKLCREAADFGCHLASVRLNEYELQGEGKFRLALAAEKGGDFGLAMKLCREATALGCRLDSTYLRELQRKEKFRQALAAEKGGDLERAVKLCREAAALGLPQAEEYLPALQKRNGIWRKIAKAEGENDLELSVQLHRQLIQLGCPIARGRLPKLQAALRNADDAASCQSVEMEEAGRVEEAKSEKRSEADIDGFESENCLTAEMEEAKRVEEGKSEEENVASVDLPTEEEPIREEPQKIRRRKARQNANARFKIWVVPEFMKEVRKAFGTRRRFVVDKLDGYVADVDSFEVEFENNDAKPMFSISHGDLSASVWKYRIGDGSRMFYVQVDKEMAGRMSVVRTDDGIRPCAGDYCLLGATASGRHDAQNAYGRKVGSRLLRKMEVELYQPEDEFDESEEEDQGDRTRRVNVSAATYAQNLPFDSYGQYCESLSDPDVKLSEEQFGILEGIVKDGFRRLTLLMGCAGSGKTLMAVTLLLCSDYGGQDGRIYFSLSDRLARSSEASFCKIAACKAYEAAKRADMVALERMRDDVVGRSDVKVGQLEALAKRHGVSSDAADEFFGKSVPEFHNANDFLLRLLGIEKSSLVTYDRFRDWFSAQRFETKIRGFCLNADDVWMEIRGLVKGYLGSHAANPDMAWHWGRTSFHQLADVFADEKERPGQKDLKEIQRVLVDCKIVTPPSRERRDFVWRKFDGSSERQAGDAIPQLREWVGKMFEIVRRDDFRKTGMESDEYLALGEEQSVYDAEQRRQIYKVYESYSQWLRDGGLNDENDLARKLLQKIAEKEFWRPAAYGALVVDECQDFSEMQLLALCRLAGESSRVVLAGDRHQIINPTYFDPERIGKLPGMGDVTPHFIKDNHRSSQEIVRISNVVAKKRRETIGSFGPKYEQEEKAYVKGFHPHFMCYGRAIDGFADELKQIYDDPQAAVIVQNKDDMERLLKVAPLAIGNRVRAMTFTIKECKGLEFKKVFCFDVLSRYQGEWRRILEGKDTRHNGKFRYYFNTLYVAVTRSQNGICLLEGESAQTLHDRWLVEEAGFRRDVPQDFLRITSEFALKVGSAREWLKRAQHDFENADEIAAYERARFGFDEAFGRKDADGTVKDDALHGKWACEVNIAKLRGRMLYAVRMCVEHQLRNLMPDDEDVSEDERRLVGQARRALDDGFADFAEMDMEDVHGVVELFAGTDEAREYVEDGISRQVEHLVNLAGELADRIRAV